MVSSVLKHSSSLGSRCLKRGSTVSNREGGNNVRPGLHGWGAYFIGEDVKEHKPLPSAVAVGFGCHHSCEGNVYILKKPLEPLDSAVTTTCGG